MTDLEYTLSLIPHFDYVHEHLFCSGQPSAEQLQLIKEYGCSTVINLALSNAPTTLVHEDQICLELDLNYIHIPLNLERPSADQAILVLELLDHLVQQQTVWLHCGNNQQCSSLIYLYRLYYMNMDMATAQDHLHKIWEPNDTWTGLIHAVSMQLQGRKATLELQQALVAEHHFA